VKIDIKNCIIVLAVVVVAFNLRPALAAFGPILDEIQAVLGMSNTQASLLTTIPVFFMGAGALCINQFKGAINSRAAIAVSIVLILIACATRYVAPSSASLLITAAVAGMGIACVQTLLPGFIKGRFGAASGNILGLYTTGIMAGSALAAAASAGLVGTLGIPGGLAVWALPALVALLLWMLATRGTDIATLRSVSASPQTERRVFYNNARAYALMIFFGISTGAYTLVLAWMPPYYTSLGWSSTHAGLLLAGITLAEVVAGVLVSMVIHKFPDRRVLLGGVLTVLLIGIVCLVYEPVRLAIPISVMLGLSIGALFPLSLILTADHVSSTRDAAQLMGFVQGGGFIIASFMPLMAGMIRDAFDSLTQAWLVMGLGAIIMLAMSMQFSPSSYVKLRR